MTVCVVKVMKERLDGIGKYHCFYFDKQAHIAWARYRSCYCKYCLNGEWNKCLNSDIIGDWVYH